MKLLKISSILFILLLSLSAHAADYGNIYNAEVISVSDGDTIKVNLRGKTEKIRMLEVDTFEVYPSSAMRADERQFRLSTDHLMMLGKQGSNFAHQMIKPGDTVGLSFGPVQRGKYDRLLAFVHLSDGRVFTEELIKSGSALVYRSRYGVPTRQHKHYLQLESEARSKRRGVWANENVRMFYNQ